MNIWLKAVLAGAVIAAAPSAALTRGMAAAGSAAVHGVGRISPHPFRFGFAPFTFRSAFPQARFGQPRFEGWAGGAYSADAVASEDEGNDPDNMIFRVQEPFGPGDLGLPRQARRPLAGGPRDEAGPMPPQDYGPPDFGPQD